MIAIDANWYPASMSHARSGLSEKRLATRPTVAEKPSHRWKPTPSIAWTPSPKCGPNSASTVAISSQQTNAMA